MECEGCTSAIDRGASKLRSRIKTQWNSVFECINNTLYLKDVITRFSKDDMELDGQIDCNASMILLLNYRTLIVIDCND